MMKTDFILIIVAIMIFWDFSLHVIELLGWDKKFVSSKSLLSYYYPHLYWKKTKNGPAEREDWEPLYQKFWIIFWGVAFVLVILYIVVK